VNHSLDVEKLASKTYFSLEIRGPNYLVYFFNDKIFFLYISVTKLSSTFFYLEITMNLHSKIAKLKEYRNGNLKRSKKKFQTLKYACVYMLI